MKFRVVQDQFLEGLQKVQSIVSTRTSLPILGNVRLEAQGSLLELTTTDLDVVVVAQVPAEIESEGVVTLPARKLSSIVRELPTSELSVEVSEDNAATIESGAAFFRILGLDAEEFPSLPEFDESLEYIIAQGLLGAAIRKTSYAISTDLTRYVLNGILLSFQEEKMTVVATDGRRLALVDGEVEFPASQEAEFIIPTKAVMELERMLGEEGDVQICLSGTDEGKAGAQASFRCGNDLLITKLIDGKFPNFRQVIPTEPRYRVPVDREVLHSTVHRISLLSPVKGQSIRLRFADNAISLISTAPEVGEAREQILINYEGDPIQTSYNPEFMMAALRKLQSDEVFIELIDDSSPGVIKVPQENFLYVIMPMRSGH